MMYLINIHRQYSHQVKTQFVTDRNLINSIKSLRKKIFERCDKSCEFQTDMRVKFWNEFDSSDVTLSFAKRFFIEQTALSDRELLILNNIDIEVFNNIVECYYELDMLCTKVNVIN